jgi:hypothetical protein
MEEETLVVDAQRRPTLEELHALIAAKEHEAATITATLGEMWQKRQQGTLPKEQYPDYLYYEDQLRVILQLLERLQPQLHFVRAEDAITKAKAHYDAFCALVAEGGLRVCQSWKTFLEQCAALVQLIDEQVSALVVLTRADGQPMFDLDSGSVTLQNMLVAFPGQPNFLPASVLPFLHEVDQITVGQSPTILAYVKGREPFSETNVERYLAGYQYEEPKPDIPVEEL